MARVFLSHSNLDQRAAARLRDWLISEGFEAPFLDFDKHSGIPPGSQWEKVLYREISRCQALLILQTVNWTASKWCFAEFTQARALGKPVFQVIEDDQAAQVEPIAPDLQWLDLRQERQSNLAILKQELIQIAEQDQGGFPWPPSNDRDRAPYPGLMVFEEDDAAVFFGRDADWRAVIEKLNSMCVQGGSKLLVIQGASGSGKSSLLRAGVLPRLRRAGKKWLVLPPFTPQAKPFEGLVQAWAIALGRANDWRRLDQQLRQSCEQGSAGSLLQEWSLDLQMQANTRNSQILISIDQAEELFTLAEKEERDLLITALSASLTRVAAIHVLMTIRADAVGLLQNVNELSNGMELYPLPAIEILHYREVIKGPARVAGVMVEEAFVEKAIRDIETEDALPLLAFALRRLYDTSDRGTGLTLRGYLAMGDPLQGLSPLENALRSQADGVFKAYQPSTDEKKALRDAFVPAMVRVSEQGNFARRIARWSELPKESYPLLEALVKERLLIKAQNREGQTTVEVAHEALLRVWPELADVLQAEQEFVWSVQQLEQDRRLWESAEANKKKDAYLTGLKLSRGRTWLAERNQQLTPGLRQYIEESIKCADQESRRRIRQRRGVLLAGGAMLSLISLSLAELARFESGIFPYSVVTGYVENFLMPVLARLRKEGVDPVFVIMMPQNYEDLDHLSRVRRYKDQLQAAGYSVKFKTVKTHLPRGAAIAEIEPQPKSFQKASRTLYIDAASTVTTFRNVIDYKKQNIFYGFSSKDAMVAHYVEDFKQSVYSLIPNEADRRRIIFAASKEDLYHVLKEGTHP